MLVVYTDRESIKDSDNFIEFIDVYFNDIIYKLKLNPIDNNYMKLIDMVSNVENGMITTVFGVTRIQNLSTGCKTLILLNHYEEIDSPIINVSECGNNVMNFIMKYDNVKIYSNYPLPRNRNNAKLIKVIFKNETRVMKVMEAIDEFWRS